MHSLIVQIGKHHYLPVNLLPGVSALSLRLYVEHVFHQVGNAAGVGAIQMLLSVDKRHEAEQIANRIQYVELTGQASFTQLFMQHLRFEV